MIERGINRGRKPANRIRRFPAPKPSAAANIAFCTRYAWRRFGNSRNLEYTSTSAGYAAFIVNGDHLPLTGFGACSAATSTDNMLAHHTACCGLMGSHNKYFGFSVEADIAEVTFPGSIPHSAPRNRADFGF
jgi:hypothetical protein